MERDFETPCIYNFLSIYILFFLLFQKGGPLSSVPMILAGGAALMAVAGILIFKEPAAWPRLLGIALAMIGLFLLRSPAGK